MQETAISVTEMTAAALRRMDFMVLGGRVRKPIGFRTAYIYRRFPEMTSEICRKIRRRNSSESAMNLFPEVRGASRIHGFWRLSGDFATGSGCGFLQIRKKMLFIEFSFDRVESFVNVRPASPRAEEDPRPVPQ